MTISQTELIARAHERAQENQPELRRRVNSSISALFGGGFIATVAAGALEVLPWWAVIIVAVALAIAEVLSQAFSKAGLAPSQVEKLTAAVMEIEEEDNPAPSRAEVQIGVLHDEIAELKKELLGVEQPASPAPVVEDDDVDELRTVYDGL